MEPTPGIDAYAPAEMARRVEETGVRKAELGLSSMLALAVLAGAFIALGAAFSTVAATDTKLGYGPSRILSGLAFSLGLILVVVAGAELFTGNNLLVMAWASRLWPGLASSSCSSVVMRCPGRLKRSSARASASSP